MTPPTTRRRPVPLERSTVRQMIRDGGRDITFDQDPELDKGERIILLNSKAGPRQWVIVEWVRQPKPGVWVARVRRYSIGAPRFLRSGPLPYTDPDRLREDQVHSPTPDVIERARVESHYRSSGDPLDAGECVGEDYLRRFSDEAKERAKGNLREAIEGS